MRIAYLDCATGISGDMTLAALIDAGVDPAAIRAAIDSLGIPGVRLHVDRVMRCGFRATHIRVEHPEQHAHRHLSHIHKLIDAAALTTRQKQIARDIFESIAAAEARVHGTTLEKIHFHEVGAIDSIVDVIGAAVGFDLLGAERILCSRIPPGRGRVKIDHGVCAVPTPGTAEILKGMPLCDVPVEAELTTPTGAAIVATLVDEFAALPAMTIEAIGYGAGTRDFADRANVLRLFVGSAEASDESDLVTLLETNLDDVSGEVIGYAKQKLLEAGALDVFSAAIQMKKDRPGVLLSVLCRPADAAKLESIVFAETGTLGIRRTVLERAKRQRREATVQTPFGPVKGKLGWRGGEQPAFSPEFDDCARIAAERGIPLRDVYRAAEAAASLAPPAREKERHTHDADDGGSHDHDHGRGGGHDHDHSKGHDHDHSRGHDHDHDHGRGKGHDHDHDHGRGRKGDGHDHDHSHDQET